MRKAKSASFNQWIDEAAKLDPDLKDLRLHPAQQYIWDHVLGKKGMTYAQINEASLTEKPKRSEHGEQCAVIDWALNNRGFYPELEYLIAIPNGGFRDKNTAKKLKAEGVKPGVSDLLLPVKRAPYSGLWLEMKAADGLPSRDQINWLVAMIHQNFAANLAWEYDQAVPMLERYLKGEWIQPPVEWFLKQRTR